MLADGEAEYRTLGEAEQLRAVRTHVEARGNLMHGRRHDVLGEADVLVTPPVAR